MNPTLDLLIDSYPGGSKALATAIDGALLNSQWEASRAETAVSSMSGATGPLLGRSKRRVITGAILAAYPFDNMEHPESLSEMW